MTSSLDASPRGVSASPSSSGRASPIPKRWSRFGHDDAPSKDKAFRKYASGVERSLSLFDTALQEWADYISFLGRLLKSLQARPASITAVPSKSIVAKRLAQCLNPLLPSGVHQKTLEVYSYLFTMIGRDALSRDLPLYLPGLSSTLSFASLAVKAPFLELFETHLLHLEKEALRPASKAIILALLPGLEEETSEDFERAFRLLNSFRAAIRPSWSEELGQDHETGDEYYWQCFFLAAITGTNRRMGALAYLKRNLPKLALPYIIDGPAQIMDPAIQDSRLSQLTSIVTSPEPGLLIRCFTAGLMDEQILIQRGFQDLLVSHLPLHSEVLQKNVKREDLELLVMAAVGVVTRREMSLNRRLWTWLLGPDLSTSSRDESLGPSGTLEQTIPGANRVTSTRYFEELGMLPLTNALLKLIAHDTDNSVERVRPYRICFSLMDRWEIGGLIVPAIFLPVIRSVRRHKTHTVGRTDFAEVLKSASVFFDGVESGLIWGEILALFTAAITRAEIAQPERLDKLSLVSFIITHFNIREEEMLLQHIPMTILAIFSMLADENSKDPGFAVVEVRVLELAVSLLELVPGRAFEFRTPHRSSPDSETKSGDASKLSNLEVVQQLRKFYMQDQGNLDTCPPPFSLVDLNGLLTREAINISRRAYSSVEESPGFQPKIRLLVLLLTKTDTVNSTEIIGLMSALRSSMKSSNSQPFCVLSLTVFLVTTLYTMRYIALSQVNELTDLIVRRIWLFFDPSQPKYHVEAVRLLWQLHQVLPAENRSVEATLCTIILESRQNFSPVLQGSESVHMFSVLWTHTIHDNSNYNEKHALKPIPKNKAWQDRNSGQHDYKTMLDRPLFLMLDALQEDRTPLFVAVKEWLHSLTLVTPLLDLFFEKLSGITFLNQAIASPLASTDDTYTYSANDDLDECLYYIRTLSNLLSSTPEKLWVALSDTTLLNVNSDMSPPTSSQKRDITLLSYFTHVCIIAISGRGNHEDHDTRNRSGQLYRSALTVLHQILSSSYAESLSDLNIDNILIRRLHQSLNSIDPSIQIMMLDVIFEALKLRVAAAGQTEGTLPPLSPRIDLRRPSAAETTLLGKASYAGQEKRLVTAATSLPIALFPCLQAGLVSQNSRVVLENWIVVPLVECLCSEITKAFTTLRNMFEVSSKHQPSFPNPEITLLVLLGGLEHVLARAHDQLMQDENKSLPAKVIDAPQGFFGNMVSGVFSSDMPHTRSGTGNNRLTILLSFKDALRICFKIWTWKPAVDEEFAASFNYTNLRTRNRARRLLEHLFAAEGLECLETVVELWQTFPHDQNDSSHVLKLLHVLDGSRPKYAIPAIFDAIYSRASPGSLEASRKSTLTSELDESSLVLFLVEFTKSLDDDAMDEIWSDCMTFLRDILTNPFPHRRNLPMLLEFAAILGEKVDNTNFGEQRKMRRELGDLFIRLLTAIFTTKPLSFTDSTNSTEDKTQKDTRDVVDILASVAGNLPKILVEQDRILLATNTISTNVIGPTFRSKMFPKNVTTSTLILLHQLSRISNTQKLWKKDVSDGFNDVRFFSTDLPLAESHWLPLLSYWIIGDKEKIPEIVSRLQPPTTAGIVFGVGATSARLEADRKVQTNLRRLVTIILAMADDSLVSDLPTILEKIVELLAASSTSSPSSCTRADVYLLIKALVLKLSPVHLAPLWPIVNTELQAAISAIAAPDHSPAADTYNTFSILQACKLLDCLICIAPDEFQLHEWLFVTDTIDAVYRPSKSEPTSLVDEVSLALGSMAMTSTTLFEGGELAQTPSSQQKRLLIRPGSIEDEGVYGRKEDLVDKVLRPFFGQLSIFAFESVYAMGKPDVEECKHLLLQDTFDERSIVKAL